MMSKSNRSISSLMAIAISGALFFTALGFFLATGVDSPTFTQADELWIDGNGSAGVEAQGPDFASVAEKMKPTVVHVVAVGKSLSAEGEGGDGNGGLPDEHPQIPPDFENAASGSGVIISPDGYVLTNEHVIAGAEEVTVIHLGEKEYKAIVVGTDRRDDLALLKIEPEGPLPAAPLGDSDAIRPGDWVMAMGNPLGFEYSVTVGIISGKGRSLPASQFREFIQTDAAIYPGNSGGPLVSLAGEVVGINTAVIPDTNLGFAVPVNAAKQILPQLLQEGRVVRGYLGVTIRSVEHMSEPPQGALEGAYVAEIHAGTPAAKSELAAGDVIVGFAGDHVGSAEELTSFVTATEPGTTVNVTVLRGGEEKTFEVLVGSLPREYESEGQAGLDVDAVDLKLGETVVDLGAGEVPVDILEWGRQAGLEDYAEKTLSALFLRRADYLPGRAFFYDQAFIHEDQTSTYFSCKTHLVGDYQHGHAFVGQVFHHFQHL